MERFVVEGGRRLSGTIRPVGNKNAALPILAACLLTDEPVTLRNLPDIRDVRVMLQLLETLGRSVEKVDASTVTIRRTGEMSSTPDAELSRKIRASILLAGPLLARTGSATMVRPGGDAIGRRRVDTHLLAFETLGATIESAPAQYTMTAPRLVGRRMFLDEASVTGTENAITAAVLADGETLIYNAAAEPHVQDLCRFLNVLGADIEGIGTNSLRIRGVRRLGAGEFRIPSDHIEVGSYIGLAAVTGGELLIEDGVPEHMDAIQLMFRKLGVSMLFEGPNIRVPGNQTLEVQYDVGAAVPKLDDGPWPLFPADLLSIMIVVATKARGTVMIFEKMFESRLFFTDKLLDMGARIILCDPHRAIVVGGSPLYGSKISSPDIRAGMALLIAALCAQGESVIQNIQQIDRGYERIDERLNALGANIRRELDR
ncbi:MAG: UDP-N-acetylglucosamine 1-carboxyvinyltransferase [Thermoanaerobaculia bacterium]|nr:UDP-N-acetylglucosamine 1-carboxyvinyltransferase [Thermoanaerobaculia bacterium]